LRTTHRLIKPFGSSQIDFPSVLGNVLLVAQEASGWIRFVLVATPALLLIYGDVLTVDIILC